jgi:hypothetical protein
MVKMPRRCEWQVRYGGVRLMLEVKADPNLAVVDERTCEKGHSHHGWTALFFAASQGDSELIKLLLRHKADPSVTAHFPTGQTSSIMKLTERKGGATVQSPLRSNAVLYSRSPSKMLPISHLTLHHLPDTHLYSLAGA